MAEADAGGQPVGDRGPATTAAPGAVLRTFTTADPSLPLALIDTQILLPITVGGCNSQGTQSG